MADGTSAADHASDSGTPLDDDRIYFRQLLAGRDIARTDQLAQQMVNFVYLVGDREAGEAVAIDPAYDTKGVLDILEADGMRLVGALATHYHPDHVGGRMMQFDIEGVDALLEQVDVPVHVQADEAEWVRKVTNLTDENLQQHQGGDRLMVGEVPIELLHTPGHTPGSQCFFVAGRHLVAGDTLFLEGCGRTDLPGGDPAALYQSLTTTLAKVPDSATLFPGHLYSMDPSATMGQTRELNFVFRPQTEEQWLRMFG